MCFSFMEPSRFWYKYWKVLVTSTLRLRVSQREVSIRLKLGCSFQSLSVWDLWVWSQGFISSSLTSSLPPFMFTSVSVLLSLLSLSVNTSWPCTCVRLWVWLGRRSSLIHRCQRCSVVQTFCDVLACCVDQRSLLDPERMFEPLLQVTAEKTRAREHARVIGSLDFPLKDTRCCFIYFCFLEESLICFQGNNICSLSDCSFIFRIFSSEAASVWGTASVCASMTLKTNSFQQPLQCVDVWICNKERCNNINVAFINKIIHHTYRVCHVK